jgi:hypothetical protein
MVTSGGWPYCEQVRGIAASTGYTLVCGRYFKDGYSGRGLRPKRHLDWGDPGYLAAFAGRIRTLRRTTPGPLVLMGVSYSGFGVGTLASHHPELRPSRVIVIDSYLDLVARRAHLSDTHITAREIDSETGGSIAELRRRSASAAGLAQLVRTGTRLVVIWSVSPDEQRAFGGATCDRSANAGTLAAVARLLGRPVPAWITSNRHGHDLWDHGGAIVRAHYPGRVVTLHPDGRIPRSAVCE